MLAILILSMEDAGWRADGGEAAAGGLRGSSSTCFTLMDDAFEGRLPVNDLVLSGDWTLPALGVFISSASSNVSYVTAPRSVQDPPCVRSQTR